MIRPTNNETLALLIEACDCLERFDSSNPLLSSLADTIEGWYAEEPAHERRKVQEIRLELRYAMRKLRRAKISDDSV